MATQLCRRVIHVNLWGVLHRVSFFRRFFRLLWDRILLCSTGRPRRYRRLRRCSSGLPMSGVEGEALREQVTCSGEVGGEFGDQDLVVVKISLLGDCQIGKTSFMIKYVGDEEKQMCFQLSGLNKMDKVLAVQGAMIAYSIWDVGGDHQCLAHVPMACKDAAAIMIMFDLTSRCILNSALGWYQQARRHNQTAIPVLIGTKFFAQLPLNIQWAIVSQAMVYARAMKATLFFSSATHNINVSKIFKFITARLFNLPWTVEWNLTIGEPIIDLLYFCCCNHGRSSMLGMRRSKGVFNCQV